jgi:N-acetylglucosaminyldiphosphoundecaprenol N-acetyl-beta-D-mannosaminyltransferase
MLRSQRKQKRTSIMTFTPPKPVHEATVTKTTWPPKADLFGIGVTPTTYAQAAHLIVDAARKRQSALVSCYSTHSLVDASRKPALNHAAARFDMITPDGQPVRWALNFLHQTGLSDRVYGPELTLKVCSLAAAHGVGVYFYGSSPEVIAALQTNLAARFPDLYIAGSEAPPFRPLTAAEDAATVARINRSGAGIVFIGLGCPKQDFFAYEHRHSIKAVQVCVGAAFDLHAGTQKMAPPCMQKRGLEWLFRFSQEPRRLWRRYVVTNSIYLLLLAKAWLERR